MKPNVKSIFVTAAVLGVILIGTLVYSLIFSASLC